jgi:hypothetical protein
MASHANLAPSAAERWISCPASVRLVADYQEGENVYAQEGTKAHALGELEASLAFGLITKRQYTGRLAKWALSDPHLDEPDLREMQGHVAHYVRFLAELVDQTPGSHVLVEQKVNTGIEQCYGTSDAIIVSPTIVHAVDLKYGQGVPVSAIGNPQLRLYGVGALEMFDDLLGGIETVRCTVFQPRLNSVSTEELTAAELREWRDGLKPIAKEALWSAKPHFGPSEDACRWCPAAGDCRARVEFMTAQDFKQPDLLEADELAELLARVPDIKSWCEDVANAALRRAYSEGEHLPGWKVVLSGGRRYVTDQDEALKLLEANGLTRDELGSWKLKGIGDLEKVLGTKLEEALGDLVQKSEGKPALAPEDDRRPAIAPNTEAARDFEEDIL